ncbi:hypothetical protein PM082_016648 [Marasmius tenuissimus]|nr:hypothetical protein PM082_016648 [Marasmius tenuissimus]
MTLSFTVSRGEPITISRYMVRVRHRVNVTRTAITDTIHAPTPQRVFFVHILAGRVGCIFERCGTATAENVLCFYNMVGLVLSSVAPHVAGSRLTGFSARWPRVAMEASLEEAVHPMALRQTRIATTYEHSTSASLNRTRIESSNKPARDDQTSKYN